MSRSNFIKVTHAAPCPACGKPDWCAWTKDGWLKCERVADTPPGMALVKLKHGGAPSRASRGLVVPTTLKDLPDPVLLVEGASDVAACLTLGLAAVGRPSNTGGAELVAELLDGREVLVVGERDQKEDGAWPGRDGARSVAKQMVSTWGGEVKWKYAARRPLVMGALFDLVAKVLRARPLMHPAELPRLADFGVVLAAMDHVLGTSALSLYMNQRNRIADDVVGADPVGEAVLTLAHREQVWSGTCQQLLGALHTERPPKGWPSTPRALAGRLRRLAPDLKLMGVEVIQPPPTKKTRVYTIRLTAQTAQPPEKCRPRDGQGASDQAVKDFSMRDRPDDRPIETWPEGFDCCDSGRSGGSGGYFPISDDRASESVVGEVDS
jgi:hypothetical protein